MKIVIEDLIDRLAMLHTRHLVAFEFVAPVGEPTMYEPLAYVLQNGLRESDPGIVTRVRAVVDPSELGAESPFWFTPLGRTLFAAGGFVETSLSRTMAAGILGCSRQWIHELVVKGELQAAPSQTGTDRFVYAEKLRTLLTKRLDALVK
jgi:hypothetical protein